MPCVARGLSRLCPSTRPWTLSIASHRSCTAPPAAATGRARPTSPPGSRTRTSTLAGFARPAWTRLSASPRGRVRENRGQAQRVELDVVGGEGRRDPRREGGGGGHRRRPGAAPGAVRSGRDGPGAPLGHIGEQTFRPQDAQGLGTVPRSAPNSAANSACADCRRPGGSRPDLIRARSSSATSRCVVWGRCGLFRPSATVRSGSTTKHHNFSPSLGSSPKGGYESPPSGDN